MAPYAMHVLINEWQPPASSPHRKPPQIKPKTPKPTPPSLILYHFLQETPLKPAPFTRNLPLPFSAKGTDGTPLKLG
ncbi:hypothetical protein CCACVL1_24025 [Corchorus capsularis]|uniref:Uncharacterized protein n=1 Tax=Corchorus capsularis TaxID=210143 RepID=A0A1R3GR65_COCAP|nr:hypothetical protein CCACVL1_24025 [Corchorus capsularis]